MLARPLAFLAIFIASGCMVGPDYRPAAPIVDPEFSDVVHDNTSLIDVSGPIEIAWWTSFNDPKLVQLIETAAESNTDIRLAIYRIEEARARAQPVVFGSSGASRIRSSETAGGFGSPAGAPSEQNLFDLSLNVNWELDLFGRLGRRENAAEARLEASKQDRRAVMVATFAEVGVAYAELRGLQDQFDIATRNIELVSRTVELTLLLAEQGLAPEFDVIRARADLKELVARREALLAGQRAAVSRIALLTGQQPADQMAELLAPGPQLQPAARIPVGLPSSLLRRRPDIQAAERRLAAASEQIGAEMADLLPSFSLTGAAGFSTANIDDLFDAESQSGSVGVTGQVPLFDGGARRAEIDIARSRYGAAGAEYDAAVLTALTELESALASYVYIAKELDGLVAARADRERAYELALLRYRSNTDSLFPALDAGLRLTSLNADIASRQQDLLIAQITVYRALGGGWK